MMNTFLRPEWFAGIDTGLELLYAIVAILTAVFAYKTYRLSGNKNTGLFSIGFLLIGISYIAFSIINVFTLKIILEKQIQLTTYLSLVEVTEVMVLIHVMTFLAGVLFLLFPLVPNWKARIILGATTFLAFVGTANGLKLFYVLGTFFLFVLMVEYFTKFLQNKKTNTALVFAAFVMLFLGRVHFFISLQNQFFYILGHGLELVGYGLMLVSVYKVVKK